jgi:hypothetical protein
MAAKNGGVQEARPNGVSPWGVVMLIAVSAAPVGSMACEDHALRALREASASAWSESAREALTEAFGAALARHRNAAGNTTVRGMLRDPAAPGPGAWSLPVLPDAQVSGRIAALRRLSGWRLTDDTAGASPATLEALAQALAEIDTGMARAVGGVADEDREALLAALPALLGQTGDRDENGRIAGLAVRVSAAADLDALAPLLDRVLGVVRVETIAGLRRELAARGPVARPAWLSPAFQGDWLYARRTPRGPLLVGAAGANTYGERAWLVVDIGGDDLYAAEIPWVFDLAGDDRYLAAADAALGAGLFGAGLVFDGSGDDLYSGGRIAQGAALFGIGVTWDGGGNDTYLAQELAQGAALFGAGLLVDLDGEDEYAAARLAQGFGGPAALGGLLDAGGRDRYVASGKYPSAYGTPTNYEAVAQGVGLGLRDHADGGVGVLWDGAGDDLYLAGNFAQGTGYYLGLGLLLDDAGDDRYLGSRYAQGSAAHLGIGVLVDRAGDDRYRGKTAANQGAAWDLSIAALVDCAGDDDYAGGEMALGAGEQNGVGWLFDAGGSDRYADRAKAFGFSGVTTYDGGRGAGNLGVFVDEGGDEDSYPGAGHAGDKRRSNRGDLGVFVDR